MLNREQTNINDQQMFTLIWEQIEHVRKINIMIMSLQSLNENHFKVISNNINLIIMLSKELENYV